MEYPTHENPYQSPQDVSLPDTVSITKRKKKIFLAKAAGIALAQHCGLMIALFVLNQLVALFVVALIVILSWLLNILIIIRCLHDDSLIVKRTDELVIKHAFWIFVVVAMLLEPRMNQPQNKMRFTPTTHSR